MKRRKPDARIEIARVFRETAALERLPECEDGRVLREHALAAIVRLTQSETASVALAAAQWLVGYSNALIGKADTGNASGVIEELRALYRKALPDRTEPLVEAELEPEGQPERAKRS